jgi:hypothetical protein
VEKLFLLPPPLHLPEPPPPYLNQSAALDGGSELEADAEGLRKGASKDVASVLQEGLWAVPFYPESDMSKVSLLLLPQSTPSKFSLALTRTAERMLRICVPCTAF